MSVWTHLLFTCVIYICYLHVLSTVPLGVVTLVAGSLFWQFCGMPGVDVSVRQQIRRHLALTVLHVSECKHGLVLGAD